MSELMKCTGLLMEQETKPTKDGAKTFTRLHIDTDQGEVKIFDWSGIMKTAHMLGKTQIYVEAGYSTGPYPRLNYIKEVEKPASFTQNTVVDAAKKDAQSFMPAQQPMQARKPSDYATSQEYLAFKLAVDLVKDEQIQVDKKIERLLQAQSAILIAWDKQKGVNDGK